MYEQIDFSQQSEHFAHSDRPFFYTNFVSTLDGKVDVPAQHAAYWPIGSAADHAALINLRVPADALVHGRNTAMMHRTVDSLAEPEFRAARLARGKKDLLYIIVSDHPDAALQKQLENSDGIQSLIVSGGDLPALARGLKTSGVATALVEGGPHLVGSFFAADMIDEIFLTLAPKIFSGGGTDTLTMAEGTLLPPEKIKKWQLVSSEAVEDELFLRYRLPAQTK